MLRAELDGAGEAWLVSLDGERGTFRSPKAFAPGAPVSVVLHLARGTEADVAVAVRGKTIGSKREPAGTFLVQMKLPGLSKEARARIAGALVPEPAP